MSASLPLSDNLTRAHPIAVMPDEAVIPLTLEAYHALINAGIFEDGDPFELLEGFLIPRMSASPQHATARRKLR